MKRTGAMVTAGVLAAVLLLAGCGSGAGSAARAATATTPSPSSSAAPTYGCLTEEQARQGAVTVRDRDKSNQAYFQDADGGPAEVALIFWHGPGGSLCDWVPHLGAFTRAGYAVIAFTSNGDFFDDLGPADHFLASRGFSKMVWVGASDTATALLERSATPVDGPLKAVVALGAPRRSGTWDPLKVLPFGKLPLLLAASEGDATAGPDDARALFETSTGRGKQLKLYPGDAKGAGLLTHGALPDVLAFLTTAVPPGK
ncbi:alpha/beta hydrolase [Kitasatospora sp. NPDC059327]|uniref:alpha/beta hydrolase n=1 Tax=Kitasatospora sp. NPDC059327 TaxID=3346803 RepID=UPI0036AD5748